MRLIVTGGAGFIGSCFIRNHLKKNPDDKIINLDNLSIGSNINNLKKIENSQNYKFHKMDIRNTEKILEISKNSDFIINFAAESHVDRSIANPKPFIDTNVYGIFSLLEAVRKYDIPIIQVSTDEVYGDAGKDKSFSEEDLLKPSNPYSATKASAEHLVKSYQRTYGIKSIITRCTNNFGPFQHPEKLIPKTIIRILKNLKIPLYGDGEQIRSWIYVQDHVEAIETLIEKRNYSEIFNITAWNEISNKTIVQKILEYLKKSDSMIEYVKDRPGHDKRYSIDASKIKNVVNWKPNYDFDEALFKTIDWYKENESWWNSIVDERALHPQPWTLNWE